MSASSCGSSCASTAMVAAIPSGMLVMYAAAMMSPSMKLCTASPSRFIGARCAACPWPTMVSSSWVCL